MTELLKQPKEQIYKLSEQVALLMSFQCDAMRNVPVSEVSRFKEQLLQELAERCHDIMEAVDGGKRLPDELADPLRQAITDFASKWEAY